MKIIIFILGNCPIEYFDISICKTDLFNFFLIYLLLLQVTAIDAIRRFKLNETFDETVIDGRVTRTTPTREGNVIVLDQRADKSKKEKDTKMVRDFRGDKMFLEMTIEGSDIVCKRVYERIDA